MDGKQGRGRPRRHTNALGSWVDGSGLTRIEVARRLGITRQYLDRLTNGTRRPDLELAVRVEDLTDGQVPVRSWLKVPKHGGD